MSDWFILDDPVLALTKCDHELLPVKTTAWFVVSCMWCTYQEGFRA